MDSNELFGRLESQARQERIDLALEELAAAGYAVVKLPEKIGGDVLGISVWPASGDRYARTQIDDIDDTISILDVPNPIATPEDALSLAAALIAAAQHVQEKTDE